MIENLEKIIRNNIYLYSISRFIVGKFLYNLIYEKEFKFFLNTKTKFMNIVDIGGNDGISSLILRKFNKDSNILCIEPNKFYEKILKKIKQKDKKFNYLICGASNKESKIKMYIPKYKKVYFRSLASIENKNFFNNHSFLPNVGIKKENFKNVFLEDFEVKIIKLDNLNLNPDLLKIDVEGHELEVLEGCSLTINKYRPLIIIEINKNNFPKIVNFMLEKNYILAIYNYNTHKLEHYKHIQNFNVNDFYTWISDKKISAGNSFFHYKNKEY
jgi:FkbM family methyltransferase